MMKSQNGMKTSVGKQAINKSAMRNMNDPQNEFGNPMVNGKRMLSKSMGPGQMNSPFTYDEEHEEGYYDEFGIYHEAEVSEDSEEIDYGYHDEDDDEFETGIWKFDNKDNEPVNLFL